jgi:hypothetical protein
MENYKKRLKDIIRSRNIPLVDIDVMLKYFPELKESEDERISKEIISWLKSTQYVPNDQVETLNSWIIWLKKQGKQKPKQEWGEGDMAMIQDAIHWINEFQKSNRCKDENDMQNSVTCENWLKSLKDRISSQPPQKWGEEDEENRINAIKYLEIFDAQAIHGDVAIPCINWLKSLKFKPNHWKPSEYDISLLEEIARNIRNNVRPFCSEVSALEDLINNIKTL